MKKNNFKKVIFGIIDVVLVIWFMAMIGRFIEFSMLTKAFLWAWFILFIIALIMKVLNQIEELRLMKKIEESVSLVEDLYDILVLSGNSPNIKSTFQNCSKQILLSINDILQTTELKKYNQEHLIQLAERINSLLDSVAD